MAAAVAGGGATALPGWQGAPGVVAAGGRQVRLSDGLVRSLAVGKVYSDHRGPVGSLDFTHDGLHLATSGEDDHVHVYSCDRAERARHLRCEKYGVSAIRFLHNNKDCALAASRREHVVKHWDFQENKYIRIFRSHTARVTSLSPHPYEDTFLSGSADSTVLLWDLRRDRPTARIGGVGPTVASFDQQGLVFAVSIGRTKLHLFDTRNSTKGEFSCFDISPHLHGERAVHFVQFSPCGKYLLVRTMDQLILVDAFDGNLICEYPVGTAGEAPGGAGSAPPEPGFSPDSQYVISGIPGGDVCVWATTSARLVHCLEGHTATPLQAAFSPGHALVATAAESLAFWIPDAVDGTEAS